MGDVILTGFWLIVGSLGFAVGLAVYGLPTIVAIVRKSPNLALIATVNLVLGGLFVPWWIALGMALWSSDRRGDVTVIQTTNLPPAPSAPPAALPAIGQTAPAAPVQGALPAAPPVQPPMPPPAPPSVSERASVPGHRFGPPPLYDDASPGSQGPSSGAGW